MTCSSVLVYRLAAFEDTRPLVPRRGDRCMEFHILASLRAELDLDAALYATTGNVILPDFLAARTIAEKINRSQRLSALATTTVSAGRINAMALIDEILHGVVRLYREQTAPDAFFRAAGMLSERLGAMELEGLLLGFTERFPPAAVQSGQMTAEAWLAGSTKEGISHRELAIEELILLHLANENPAFAPFRFLFDNGAEPDPREESGSRSVVAGSLAADPRYEAAITGLEEFFAGMPAFGPAGTDLFDLLRAPMRASPDSLTGQLEFIRTSWGFAAATAARKLLGAFDLINEEETPRFPPGAGPGPVEAYSYQGADREYEAFSPDLDWMPRAVMIAKSCLVWLHQLSVRHGETITRLDEIPDSELDAIASRGFTVLWLIGLWERSEASERIKKYCGNPEAAASAYSLFDYEIAEELGGWEALAGLRDKCRARGIRLAADMVPNHTGIDSAWVRHRPELFVSSPHCPYPGYRFNGPDLSRDPAIGIWLEDHYYDRSDAAVVFKRQDRRTGRIDYLYHGNDGTGMAWNDTAQIDFLNSAARQAVMERILHVARNFSVIRFDAAMVLARRHIRRLWYPEPGAGGAVPSRSGYALSGSEFDAAMPNEFWREVVDLCAKEAPDTLLLAEAFWMLEGYFVRTLGMHRVYNSAFMNMLKLEENAKYRETIRNTQEFDPEVLRRFVNFLNNPDEEPAIVQFGDGDKYFGVCTLMATMPGLPMFGHGQVEGLREKYGMEYRRSYHDEQPDRRLIARHEREIFPLLRRRSLFAGVENFHLYDFMLGDSVVDENVFAYSNGTAGDLEMRSVDDLLARRDLPPRGQSRAGASAQATGVRAERSLVLYNNTFGRTSGSILRSCSFAVKDGEGGKSLVSMTLAESLGVSGAPGQSMAMQDPVLLPWESSPSPAYGASSEYLVMRELRSGLWYLFPCDEIRARGLRFTLDGYASLVFADMYLLRETPEGACATVASRLAGAGVASLADEFAELRRGPLYAAFAGCLAAVSASLEAYAASADRTPWWIEAGVEMDAQTALELAPQGLSELFAAASRLGEAFLATLSGEAQSLTAAGFPLLSPEDPEVRSNAARFALSGAMLALMRPGIGIKTLLSGQDRRTAAFQVVIQVLHQYADTQNFTTLLRHLGLERKGRAFIDAATPKAGDGTPCFDAAAWCLSFAGRPSRPQTDAAVDMPTPEGQALAAASRALSLALWAQEEEAASRCLGINTWQGVSYFVRENFERALALSPMLVVMEHAANLAVAHAAALPRIRTKTPVSAPDSLASAKARSVLNRIRTETPQSAPGAEQLQAQPDTAIFSDAAIQARHKGSLDIVQVLTSTELRSGYRCQHLILMLESIIAGTTPNPLLQPKI